VRVLNQGSVVGQSDGVRLRFEVSDTGVGLAPMQIEQLFSAFNSVEGPHHRRLDRAPGHADGLTGLQILVVEDHLFNLEVTRDILEQAGALVMTAIDGEQALDIMRTVAFDCVLMDLQMPKLDRLAATRLIRQDSALASTLVIGLAVNSYREHRAACLDAGMHTVLTKASEPAQLVATILDFLERLGRLPNVSESAHSLKSSCKAVGALPLAQRCQDLEGAGRANDEAACQRLLADVQAGFLRVQALIQARL